MIEEISGHIINRYEGRGNSCIFTDTAGGEV